MIPKLVIHLRYNPLSQTVEGPNRESPELTLISQRYCVVHGDWVWKILRQDKKASVILSTESPRAAKFDLKKVEHMYSNGRTTPVIIYASPRRFDTRDILQRMIQFLDNIKDINKCHPFIRELHKLRNIGDLQKLTEYTLKLYARCNRIYFTN